jgi:hypothetical protein
VLELKYKCLLRKYLVKLLTEEGMWQQLLHNKYLNNKTLEDDKAKLTDSLFLEETYAGLRMIFLVDISLKWEMGQQSVFGKTFGLVIHL